MAMTWTPRVRVAKDADVVEEAAELNEPSKTFESANRQARTKLASLPRRCSKITSRTERFGILDEIPELLLHRRSLPKPGARSKRATSGLIFFQLSSRLCRVSEARIFSRFERRRRFGLTTWICSSMCTRAAIKITF